MILPLDMSSCPHAHLPHSLGSWGNSHKYNPIFKELDLFSQGSDTIPRCAQSQMCVPAASSEKERMVGSQGIAVQVVPILTLGRQDFERMFHVGTGCSCGGRFPGDSARKATCASKGGYRLHFPRLLARCEAQMCALTMHMLLHFNFVHMLLFKLSIDFIWGPKPLLQDSNTQLGPLHLPFIPHPSPSANSPHQSSEFS